MLLRPVNDPLTLLETGPLFRFADWPEPSVPKGAAGVYSIWRGEELLYVGMAKQGNPETSGLYARLRSHASGRRGADQFCLYVFDRLLLPTLSGEQVVQAASGQLSLDRCTREFIRRELSFRYAELERTADAELIESQGRGGILACGFPRLNPLN